MCQLHVLLTAAATVDVNVNGDTPVLALGIDKDGKKERELRDYSDCHSMLMVLH